MLRVLIVVVLFTANLFAGQQPAAKKPAQKGQPAGVVYLPARQLEESASKPGSRVVDRDHYAAMFFKRTAPGEAELHDGETDIFYIVDGSATLVTGGTIEGAKTTAPGEIRGTAIRGGTTHKMSKGDAIVIPKQTPHWYNSVNGTLQYFIVKIKE